MVQSPELGDLYPEEKILIETHLATDEQEILNQIHQFILQVSLQQRKQLKKLCFQLKK